MWDGFDRAELFWKRVGASAYEQLLIWRAFQELVSRQRDLLAGKAMKEASEFLVKVINHPRLVELLNGYIPTQCIF